MNRRVLLITRNLPPLVGGMERLNWHMAQELARYADVRVVGPKGAASLAPPEVRVIEVPLKPIWLFLVLATWRALLEALRWKPNFVIAGSGLMAPSVLAVACACGATPSAYVHGLDIAVRHLIYRLFWLQALKRMKHVVANSHATASLAVEAGIESGCISIVHPGVALPRPRADAAEARHFIDEHSLGGYSILLSVGRLSSRKGLREFVAEAFPLIIAEQPNVLLLVAGEAPKLALHAVTQSAESILDEASRLGLSDRILFLGTITDYQQLGVLYTVSSVHVFPVREMPGDPEGFGMVAIEAAAHGLPTVSFATGGIVDAVCEGQSGRLVPPGDYSAFARAVIDTLRDKSLISDACRAHARKFAWDRFGESLAQNLGITSSRR